MTPAAGPLPLYGYGRIPWDTARPLLDGCACTWTDFDGLHLTDTPPPDLPRAATHLWGWTADGSRLVRLRFDTPPYVYAAVLGATLPPAPEPMDLVIPIRRPVVLRPGRQQSTRSGTSDAPADLQAAPLPDAFTALRWELAEVPGTAPVTFVRAVPKETAA
ncbi:hypothetical protein [Streptomyces aidingensis]|uniref:Uncharacterized protein n=1 Tax=Streptomyces aidingensis TaxID=910347 RepID=A0A1I1NIE5_9ACTN|nr:hypothetical protein [Streptomyces aidingensis]SFC97307.1 hypothetical protein SAMN05421773_10814 [Streptomyces aidingensis]